MLAPQDDEILLLQIVLREAQRAAPLSMITLRRLSHGTCRASRCPAKGRVSRARRHEYWRRSTVREMKEGPSSSAIRC